MALTKEQLRNMIEAGLESDLISERNPVRVEKCIDDEGCTLHKLSIQHAYGGMDEMLAYAIASVLNNYKELLK